MVTRVQSNSILSFGLVCCLIFVIVIILVLNQWLFLTYCLSWIRLDYLGCWLSSRHLFYFCLLRLCVCLNRCWRDVLRCIRLKLLLRRCIDLVLCRIIDRELIEFTCCAHTWLRSIIRLLLHHVCRWLHLLLHLLLRLYRGVVSLKLLLHLLWLHLLLLYLLRLHLLSSEVIVHLLIRHILLIVLLLLGLLSTAHHHVWLLVTTHVTVELLVHHIRHLLLLLWATKVL